MGGCIFLSPSLTFPQLCEPNSQRGAFPAGLFSPLRLSGFPLRRRDIQASCWGSRPNQKTRPRHRRRFNKQKCSYSTPASRTRFHCYSNQTERITPLALKLHFFHFLVCLWQECSQGAVPLTLIIITCNVCDQIFTLFPCVSWTWRRGAVFVRCKCRCDVVVLLVSYQITSKSN